MQSVYSYVQDTCRCWSITCPCGKCSHWPGCLCMQMNYIPITFTCAQSWQNMWWLLCHLCSLRHCFFSPFLSSSSFKHEACCNTARESLMSRCLISVDCLSLNQRESVVIALHCIALPSVCTQGEFKCHDLLICAASCQMHLAHPDHSCPPLEARHCKRVN